MTHSIYKQAVITAALGLALVAPAFALAQTASTTVSAAVMTRAKEKANTEIDRRVKVLQDLAVRVGAMTKVTADFKANLNTNVQTQISGLAALKTKIAADQDGPTLRADISSITQAYRIFALVVPQARIAAAADREATIINMLAGIGAKLQARVQAAGAAGGNVTDVTAELTRMGESLGSAQAHAQAAVASSAVLVPDGGDKDKMKANTDALVSARKEVGAAHADLAAARKSVDTILKSLHALAPAAAASASGQAQ
ncbi:MAG TPA: hypothetical protein VHD55_01315 [Candidatus Paceibacterota bacterium]|nr:hypothetical protein [Candidatus Paceibacterota bacterium]